MRVCREPVGRCPSGSRVPSWLSPGTVHASVDNLWSEPCRPARTGLAALCSETVQCLSRRIPGPHAPWQVALVPNRRPSGAFVDCYPRLLCTLLWISCAKVPPGLAGPGVAPVAQILYRQPMPRFARRRRGCRRGCRHCCRRLPSAVQPDPAEDRGVVGEQALEQFTAHDLRSWVGDNASLEQPGADGRLIAFIGLIVSLARLSTNAVHAVVENLGNSRCEPGPARPAACRAIFDRYGRQTDHAAAAGQQRACAADSPRLARGSARYPRKLWKTLLVGWANAAGRRGWRGAQLAG